MKFLVDAQLPRRLAREIIALGGEATHTLDLPSGNRTADDEIMRIAIQTQSVVVTKDRDFVDRFLLRGGPPKLVFIATGNIPNAGLLALLLWFYYPFRRRDGEVTALMFTLHPLSRFLLEIVRADEGGQFGTGLTISQWVSIGLFVVGLLIWWYVESQPRGSAVPAKRLATA